MTKEGNQPGPKITTTFSCHGCSLCVSEHYQVQSDSGFDIYCTHGGAKKDIGNGSWNTPNWCPFRSQPTPPTPAGAGTEMPLVDAALVEPYTDGSMRPVKGPALIGDTRFIPEDLARDLERELTSLRRQAEADRATREEQMQALGLCDDDRTVIADEIRRIRDEGRGYFHELTSLRAQLASADKDRERLDILSRNPADLCWDDEKRLWQFSWSAGKGYGYSFCHADIRVVIDAIASSDHDAAIQPSASLDHGARGTVSVPKLQKNQSGSDQPFVDQGEPGPGVV